MNLNKTWLAAAVVGLSIASGAAQASSFSAPSLAGGSQLLFSAYDSTTSYSYQVNLNITDQAFLAIANTANSFSFNDTAAQTFFTGAAGHAITFGVVAADGKFTANSSNRNALFTQDHNSPNQYGLPGLLSATDSSGNPLKGPFANANTVNTGFVTALSSWITIANSGITATANTKGGNGFDSLSTASTDTYNANKDGFGPALAGKLAIGSAGAFPDQVTTDASGSGVADFVVVNANASGVSQAPSLLGQWTLSYTNTGATLNYSIPTANASAVPVPAAAWMMLTGLVALLPMRRNRKA